MYVSPNTNVRILKNVPLDNTYRNTIFFLDQGSRISYFSGKTKYNLTQLSYQAPWGKPLRVEINAENLYDFGMQIGVAFQLQDDLLDVYGDPAVFGKNIGGDILCNKKTYMLIKALERADRDQLEGLNHWLSATSFCPEEKISAVTELYTQIGIKAVCENKMREYYTRAMTSLGAVSVIEDKKSELKKLMKHLMYREM